MGNTGILFEALKSGGIDVYPDYTGTIGRELLNRMLPISNRSIAARPARARRGGAARLREYVRARHAGQQGAAARRAHHRRSREASAVALGLSHEFLNRNDGWPGLQRAYGLPQSPSGARSRPAYEALAGGQIDVMDIYSTDAKIAKYKLRVLQDDKHYFP
jgi:osmoprotectant transport system permease protein